MIPILASGEFATLNTDKPGVAAAGATDAGSGGAFGQILSAQGQPAQAQTGGQNPSGFSNSSGNGSGNPLHPGGNSLPVDPSASGDIVAALAFDLQALTSTDALPGTTTVQDGTTELPEEPLLTAVPGILLTEAAQLTQQPAQAAAGPATQLPLNTEIAAQALAAQRAAAATAPDTALAPGTALTQEGVIEAGRPTAAPALGAVATPGPAVQPVTVQALVATEVPAGQVPVIPEPGVEQEGPDPRLARTPADAVARPVTTSAERMLTPESTVFSAQMKDMVAEEMPVLRTAPDPGTLLTGAEVNRAASPAPAQAPAPIGAALPPLLGSTTIPGARIDAGVTLTTVTGDVGWNNEVAGRISMMLRNGTSEAKLQLNPPELGRMDVKITSEGDQTRVLFTVQGADTREVVEQALPRLRELLAESGLTLSGFDVADQPETRQGSGGEVETRSQLAAAEESSVQAEIASAPSLTDSRSLVDYYV